MTVDISLYDFEAELQQRGYRYVAGVDEAGRGSCAGPLVAAACILPPMVDHQFEILADSKKLTPRRRELAYQAICDHAVAVSWVRIEAEECDEWGIQRANLEAIRRAVAGLDPSPEYVVSDGFAVPGLEVESIKMIKGDQKVACVAAASIVAKVVRDRLMCDYDEQFPQYGFKVHKGYATAAHQAKLEEFGPCPIHRLSYGNVARTRRLP